MQNLQPFHTFHIPTQAREIIEAHSVEELQSAWAHATTENLPALFLGQGSNMLFLENFNGVVILNRLNAAQCAFGYRESIFKHRYQYDYVIIAVGLKLAKDWRPVLQYGSLKEFDPQTVSAKHIFDEVCRIRQSKLPNPDEFGNAGSFFKNPVVSAEQFADIKKQHENLPHFPQTDGTVKLAAGWLIDQCQLKGYQIGGAAVHEKQALVLINKGNATGADVVALARHVRQTVAEKFGVYLQPEVRFMGENGEVNSEKAIA